MFGSYSLTFGMNNDDYMKAITSIKVNSTSCTSGYVSNNNKYSIAVTDGSISLGNSAFTEDNNIVTITATGYKELTVTITKDGNLVDNDNSNSGQIIPVAIPVATVTQAKLLKKIIPVTWVSIMVVHSGFRSGRF